VAARLFAARGFARVTVRDICQKARANVAAINYHFGGKTGLYEEVLRAAIETMQGATESARQAGEGRDAAGRLEAYVTVFLQCVARARESWIHQLMMRELSDPTPALDLVVRQVVRPRMAYLAGVVADLLDCDPDEDRVIRSVMSIHAQIHILLNSPVTSRMYGAASLTTADQITAFAQHITRFSLAGIRAVATR
jgi:AcrR family transcriptional regulator